MHWPLEHHLEQILEDYLNNYLIEYLDQWLKILMIGRSFGFAMNQP